MNEHKKYHREGKARVGPGGIRCPCCNPMHEGRSQKATKQWYNRRTRRKLKENLRDLDQ
jgi:hypothetical protein